MALATTTWVVSYILSKGALNTIMEGADYKRRSLVMQVLGVTSGVSDKEAHHILLSDGKYTMSAILTTQTIERTASSISIFSIIRINRFVTRNVNSTGKGNMELLILDMEVIAPGEEVGTKIGSPKPLDEAFISCSRNELASSKALAANKKISLTRKNLNMDGIMINWANYKLSEGALGIIMCGGDYEQPVMQVLGCKKVTSGSLDKQRYRILLSDGKNSISFAMLTTQTMERVGPEGVPMFSIIRINKFITSVVNHTGKGDTRILLILDMHMIVSGDKVGKKIGSPKVLDDASISCSRNEQALATDVEVTASNEPTNRSQ